MRISDWSSDVCSSDLGAFDTADVMTGRERVGAQVARQLEQIGELRPHVALHARDRRAAGEIFVGEIVDHLPAEARFVVEEVMRDDEPVAHRARVAARSEEHTSELQSLMRISYAVV